MATNRIIKMRDAETGQPFDLDVDNNTRTYRDESGRLVTMDLGVGDVHIDSALANYAAGYRQVDGVADLVSPVIPVNKFSNKFFTWDKDDVFQDVETLTVGPGGTIYEVSPRLSSTNYSTVGYGVSSFVATELDANADAPLQVGQAAIRRCMNAIHLGRERRVAALVTTAGSWAGGYTTTLGATAKWNGGGSSNPVQDIYSAIEASLTPVRAIVMSEQLWHDFVQNAAVQKYTGYKQNAPAVAPSAQASEFAALLGLPTIIIARMKGKVTASTYGYVWGNNVALLQNDPTAPTDGQTIATSYTFRFTGADSATPDGNNQQGFLLRSWFEPKRGARGGRMYAVVHNDAEVLTAAIAGGLLVGAHQ